MLLKLLLPFFIGWFNTATDGKASVNYTCVMNKADKPQTCKVTNGYCFIDKNPLSAYDPIRGCLSKIPPGMELGMNQYQMDNFATEGVGYIYICDDRENCNQVEQRDPAGYKSVLCHGDSYSCSGVKTAAQYEKCKKSSCQGKSCMTSGKASAFGSYPKTSTADYICNKANLLEPNSFVYVTKDGEFTVKYKQASSYWTKAYTFCSKPNYCNSKYPPNTAADGQITCLSKSGSGCPGNLCYATITQADDGEKMISTQGCINVEGQQAKAMGIGCYQMEYIDPKTSSHIKVWRCVCNENNCNDDDVLGWMPSVGPPDKSSGNIMKVGFLSTCLFANLAILFLF